jgi:RNA 2',3'-cyclic 3'-phosphodiesterase
MKRIFIAVKLDPGETLLSMLSAFRNALRDENIKWAETGNFHITLAFLGDTEEKKVKSVSRMLKEVCEGSESFEMVIKGAGLFRSLKEPRVIWTGIEPSLKLNELFYSIKTGLKDTGINIEDRIFSPHLTLCRIKSIKDAEQLKSLISGYSSMEIQKQEVTEVTLFESLLFHSGPVYKPLGKFALGR